MYTLGINESHGASACLFEEGRLIAAVMEERFSRLKNDETYPRQSIDFCLRQAGIEGGDIDAVAMASHVLNPLYSMYKRNSGFSIDDWLKEQNDYWKPILLEGRRPSYREMFAYRHDPQRYPYHYDFSSFTSEADWGDAEKFLQLRKATVCAHLGIGAERIQVVPHYRAHSYYGLYASQLPREPTLVFHAESGGDGQTASIMRFDPDMGLSPVMLTDQCYLGRIYKFLTLVLGMIPANHEYKIMGLAPYAYESYIRRSYRVFENLIRVEGLDFVKSPELTDCYHYFIDRLRGHRFDGIAGALQRFTEGLLTTWVANAVRQTGISQVVFSGGVSMNVKANKAIGELNGVDSFFVPPSGGDESLSIGAAYKLLEDRWRVGRMRMEDIGPLTHAYLGPAYDRRRILAAVEASNAGGGCVIRTGASANDVAGLLADGKVVARLCGRMEFGARALGNRSILADPRDRRVVKKVNEKIKSRDFWMPFCPSILEERASDYLVNPKGFKAPFMTLAFDTRSAGRNELIAALHPADFTARPNLVSAEVNPEYHAVIKAFEKLTGTGAVLNTSLNRHGHPIDCTPEDGLSTFANSGLDAIVMEDVLITRGESRNRGAKPGVRQHPRTMPSYCPDEMPSAV